MQKTIQIDTRQKMGQKHHLAKEQWFVDNGYAIVKARLLVGDYAFPNKMNVSVDTKQNELELYNNLITQHRRFHDECVQAQTCGIKLCILVETKNGFLKPEDILRWENPRMKKYWKEKCKAERNGLKPPKPPASNVQLLKIMHSMSRDYGVEFLFCTTEEAAPTIVKLLEGTYESRR